MSGDAADEREIQEKTIFLDDYTSGYGKDFEEIKETIKTALCSYGIPFDATYTGKAFLGMKKFLQQNDLCGKNILFIHTGGMPLFFDALRKEETAASQL